MLCASRALVQGLVLSLAALVAGCGGGGGGGGGGDPPAAPVTVGPPGVSAVNATVIQGSRLAPVQLSGALTGPVESLAGRTIFVSVEDPAALFEPAAFLTVDNVAGGGWRWTLNLNGRTLADTGRRTGTIRLRACLDAACATPLAGTPIALPFDVTVEAPVVLSTTRIEISSAFGTQPAPVRVTVTIPSLSSAWSVRNTTPFDPDRPQRAIVSPTGPFSPVTGGWLSVSDNVLEFNRGAGFDLQFAPAPPGVYRETLGVLVETRLPTGEVSFAGRTIDVVYTVTPTPGLRHQFYPAEITLTRSAASPLPTPLPSLLVTSTGVTATVLGIDYLSEPPGATGFQRTRWLTAYPLGQVVHCISMSAPVVYDCLSPGVYRAQVRVRLNDANGFETVVLPVTLTVTP